MNKLIIIGAGQYGQNVKDIVVSNGNYEDICFADDNSPSATYTVKEALDIENVDYSIAIGDSSVREALFNKVVSQGKNVISIVHKSAYIANSATLDVGCIVEPNVVVNANCIIGKCTLLCAGSIVNHNVVIGDYSHIDVGAVIAARVTIKENTKVHAGEIYV